MLAGLAAHPVKLSAYPIVEPDANSPYGEDIELETSIIRIVSDRTDPPIVSVIAAPTIAMIITIASNRLRLRRTTVKTDAIFTGLTPFRGRRLTVRG